MCGFGELSLGTSAVPQDEEEDLYKRDFSSPTLEDHFNKTILPKVMQVRHAWMASSLVFPCNVCARVCGGIIAVCGMNASYKGWESHGRLQRTLNALHAGKAF